MGDKYLFPKGFGVPDDRAYLDEVSVMLDSNRIGWIDADGKPVSCYQCPFVVWYRDYKRCSALRKQLHPCFRIDARLKDCPVKITGIKD